MLDDKIILLLPRF